MAVTAEELPVVYSFPVLRGRLSQIEVMLKSSGSGSA